MVATGWKDCLANGIQNGPFASRKELRSLSNEERYLLIEGLARFQHVEMTDPLSYFQIAGIHGYPFKKYPFFAKPDSDEDWNKNFPPSRGNTVADGFQGFCTHTSILFLPWHRPYLALFESTLYEHVNKIAEGIEPNDPTKEKYVQLATTFRWPYWDWARRDTPSVVPFETAKDDYASVFTQGFDVKTLPKSKESVFQNGVELYNPLHHAPFQPDDEWPEILKKPAKDGSLKGSDLDGVKFKNPKDQKYVDKTVRYPQLTDAQASNNLLYAFKRWDDDPSWRPGQRKPNGQKSADTRDLINPFRNLTERVAYLLLSYKDYAAMSHNKYNPDYKADDFGKFDPNKEMPPAQTSGAEKWASMEGIHNTCHNTCGGIFSVGSATLKNKKPNPDYQDWSGHMSGITRSAFDPIFWLHHSNIDRLWAIWQALHEEREDSTHETFVTTQTAGAGNWFSLGDKGKTKAGKLKMPLPDKETAETFLLPFKYAPGQDDWYQCAGTRFLRAFNYTYPELEGLDSFPISDDAFKKLVETIHELYPGGAALIQESKRNEGKEGDEDNAGEILLKQVAALQKIKDGEMQPTWEGVQQDNLIEDDFDFGELVKMSTTSTRRIRDIAPDNKYLEWIVNIKGQRHALDGDYVVGIFLDQFAESDPLLWPLSPNLVGTFAPLGQRPDTQCGNCQEQQADEVEVTAQIQLTTALIERYLAGTLRSYDEDTITSYLKENLYWRVASAGQLLDDQSEIAGLKVFVVTNEVTLTDSGLPHYAPDVQIHASITEGRGHGTGLGSSEVTISATVALAHDSITNN